MRSILFILLFSIVAISHICVIVDSKENSCVIFERFHMFVINDIPEDIKLHVKSKDDDLGIHILPYKTVYDWSFCFVTHTVFSGELWWRSKYITLYLVDGYVFKTCDKQVFGTRHCYWLVRPEGFYIGVKNNTWPDSSWIFVRPWP